MSVEGGTTLMWRPRDRERYIGSYDPEHEMPDADRDRGDRWQSDAYRHNARDGRFAYRWNPDRFEDRARSGYGYGNDYGYERGREYRGGFNSDRDWGRDRDLGAPRGYYRSDYDRGF